MNEKRSGEVLWPRGLAADLRNPSGSKYGRRRKSKRCLMLEPHSRKNSFCTVFAASLLRRRKVGHVPFLGFQLPPPPGAETCPNRSFQITYEEWAKPTAPRLEAENANRGINEDHLDHRYATGNRKERTGANRGSRTPHRIALFQRRDPKPRGPRSSREQTPRL